MYEGMVATSLAGVGRAGYGLGGSGGIGADGPYLDGARAAAVGCIPVRAGEHVMTSISVIIPCYKYGHFLEDAVTSVLDDQKGVDVRVLIIDDASPDDSADVARKIAAHDPRVEVTVHSDNKGNIATYNEGLLEWADGDYCVLMSADDRLTPGALRRARDLLDANPDVGFVYGHPLWVMPGASLPTARKNVRGWSVWPGQWWLERRFRDAENPITSPEVVVRTSVQKRVGGYDARLPHAADMEMWMRLAANADVGFVRGADQAYYRLHEQNMRKSFSELMDLRQRRLVFEVALDRYGDRLRDAKCSSDLVLRKIAQMAVWAAGRVYDRGGTRETSVDELLAFAVDCWPEVRRLPLYRTLQLRKNIGPRAMLSLEPFIRSALFTRKVQSYLRRRSWKYRGF
jgi:glycosyltransferase involved in cell wall biosynthesis